MTERTRKRSEPRFMSWRSAFKLSALAAILSSFPLLAAAAPQPPRIAPATSRAQPERERDLELPITVLSDVQLKHAQDPPTPCGNPDEVLTLGGQTAYTDSAGFFCAGFPT